MDATKFVDAVAELADTKGLSRSAIIFALEEALKKAYIKFLGGGDDAIVTCTIDENKGRIELAQIKKVVEEVEDDYLEISVEDANEGLKKPKYKVGDDYAIVAPVEELSKVTALAVKSNLRQRLTDAERTMLYDVYKDHIGEMMTGIVEKADERSVIVKIDRTSIEVGRKELIGDEYFRVGDPIKVYIQEVKSAAPVDGKPARGPQIQATRSSEGFLKRLFEEEIHEIYDGTVVIKAMARNAGVRSKVAVVSMNEDVDATGACVGQGGSRIQKIVAQLGNGKNKEKIDIINYHENPGLFLIEAVRPAQALGLNVEEDEKYAEILIEDGTTPLALGKFKSNLSLAKKITGYNIDFVERSKAQELGLRFTSIEEWKARGEEERKEAERLSYLKKQQEEMNRREAERIAREEAAAALKAAEEEKKPEQEEMPEIIVKPAVAPKADVRPEEFPASAMNPAAAALEADRRAKEARAAEAAAKAAEEAQPTSVATTTTLEDLEKELEKAKEKKTTSAAKTKRPRKITEEEVSHETTVKPAVPTMPVYTEEELSQIESEEAEAFEDANEEFEEDYSDYDDYYDDDRN